MMSLMEESAFISSWFMAINEATRCNNVFPCNCESSRELDFDVTRLYPTNPAWYAREQ